MARPTVKIDWAEVGRYFEAGCTVGQVAGLLAISQKQLNIKCRKEQKMTCDEFKRLKQSDGHARILRAQYEAALDGDREMLKWYGINHLGQSNKERIQAEPLGFSLDELSTDDLKKLIENGETDSGGD